MNLEEMATTVLTDLGEDPASPKVYSLAQVYTAINNGHRTISEATEWYEVVFPIPILARRTYFDLRNYGYDFLTILHIHNSNTNRWLNPNGVRDHDDAYTQWEFQSGAPEDFFIRGFNWLGVWPRQEGDGGFLRCAATAMPPPLTRLTDVPGFLEEFQQGLIEYAKYELKAIDHQNQVALTFFAAYLEHEIKLQDWVNSRRSLDKLHVLGQW